MFRDRVIEHYRVRGYKVHERVKVRGRSGGVHACDLVAQGPLGNLIVSFGDAGGFEGPELTAVRNAAQDIGAAAVVAVPHAAPPVEAAARALGVKILDEAAVSSGRTVGREEESPEFSVHPWPDHERRKGKEPELWKHPRASKAVAEAAPKAAAKPSFAWLQGEQPRPAHQQARSVPEPVVVEPAAPPVRTENVVRVPVVREAAPPPAFDWKWVVMPAVYGVVTALVLFLFVALFL